jgi:hypothetical protein
MNSQLFYRIWISNWVRITSKWSTTYILAYMGLINIFISDNITIIFVKILQISHEYPSYSRVTLYLDNLDVTFYIIIIDFYINFVKNNQSFSFSFYLFSILFIHHLEISSTTPSAHDSIRLTLSLSAVFNVIFLATLDVKKRSIYRYIFLFILHFYLII